MTLLGAQVQLTDSGHLIEAHVHAPGRVNIRVAYAVHDLWGWAVMARASNKISTVGRVDHGRPDIARQLVTWRLERLAATWTPADVDTDDTDEAAEA